MKNEFGALMLWIDRKLNRNQDVLVTKIDSIQNLFETSAEATASSADILEGKTAYNGTTLITGTMENQGAKEATLLAGGIYNIPRGWHDGAGRVTATDLDSQTPGTATAGGILSGLKAWVAGQLINGVMKDRRGVTVTAGAVTQDDEYTYLTVPEEACFNANSKLRTKNSNISSNFERYTGVTVVKQTSNATNASATYTAVNDLEDLIVTVSIVNTACGGGNYTTTIHANGKLIAANANDFFSLGAGMSKFVTLKKGQTVSIVNSGKATTATDYAYKYGTTIYRLT